VLAPHACAAGCDRPRGVVIVSLALTLVVGAQAFDALAVHAGDAAVLPLERLFERIASDSGILVALLRLLLSRP
jgi:hypothetical protein